MHLTLNPHFTLSLQVLMKNTYTWTKWLFQERTKTTKVWVSTSISINVTFSYLQLNIKHTGKDFTLNHWLTLSHCNTDVTMPDGGFTTWCTQISQQLLKQTPAKVDVLQKNKFDFGDFLFLIFFFFFCNYHPVPPSRSTNYVNSLWPYTYKSNSTSNTILVKLLHAVIYSISYGWVE